MINMVYAYLIVGLAYAGVVLVIWTARGLPFVDDPTLRVLFLLLVIVLTIMFWPLDALSTVHTCTGCGEVKKVTLFGFTVIDDKRGEHL